MNKQLVASIAAAISFSSLGITTAFASTNTFQVEHNCFLKSQPNLHRASRVELVRQGTTIKLLNKYDRWWYHVDVNGKVGYITTNRYYVQAVSGQAVPTTSTKTITTHPTTPVKTQTQSKDVIYVIEGNGVPATINLTNDTPQQQMLIKTALTQLGVPYWWGHQVPNYAPVSGRDGFDCSNFVAWTYRTALGIRFSGSSVYQRFHVGTPVTIDSTDKTKYLQPGDLLFFANASEPNGQGHVGMYIGSGLIVQEGGGHGKVTVESLYNRRAWFGRSLVFARRVSK